MLSQQKKVFGAKSAVVKSIAATALLFAATPAIAQVSTTAYKVRFSKSLTTSDAGIEKVYEMFTEKAEKACKSGKTVDLETDVRLSEAECIVSLVSQFVETSDIPALTSYHAAQLDAAK
jgi:UrcA family protein